MQVIGSLKNYPARALVGWYLVIVLLGTLALWHPLCHAESARPLSLLDAVFTATSATCVTGLAVRSTEQALSGWGQGVVLLLIQIGGIGIMTITTYVMLSIGQPASLRQRAVLTTTLGTNSSIDLKWILRYIVAVVVIAEGLGFVLLALHNLVLGMPWSAALWDALFHAISAFCNAGFSLHEDSLVAYQGDWVLSLTIIGLVVSGGIGFPVLLDLKHKWQGNWRECWDRLTLHSKLMLLGTAALLLFGTVSFLVLEWRNTLHDVPLHNRLLVALFHSVTCRTAGFNNVDIASLTNAMLFVSMLLMMVGGGPGSTAGGFKVSTLAILALQSWSSFHGREKVHLFRRTIPRETAVKAMVTALLFLVLATVALTLLLALEQSKHPHVGSEGLFLDATFEVISALGTVGLSTGLTTELTSLGRVIIIGLMFIGRIGPITIFAALARSEQPGPIEYSTEEPLIG